MNKHDIFDYWDFLNFKYDSIKAFELFQKSDDFKNFMATAEIGETELNSLFPNPNVLDDNNDGDNINYISDEFELINEERICQSNDFGWINSQEEINDIVNNKYYVQTVLESFKQEFPERVRKEIELNCLHILGRCNNPNNWGSSTENRQGLVYGMVQSGKTANILNLMGLGLSVGFNLFIVLSGDKDSLRNQTQTRVNKAFKLNRGTNENFTELKSITSEKTDYINVAKETSALDLWGQNIESNKYFICIKKEINNIRALVNHLNELSHYFNEQNKDSPFKCLIIDDEADYGSQDTAINKGGTPLHNALVDLRHSVEYNTYIAYTATPQACISADPNKLIGYPKDFIWLLEPFASSDGTTETYMGLEEYFSSYPDLLTFTLNDKSWPFYSKNNETGKKLGLYNSEGNLVKSQLVKEEKKILKQLIVTPSKDSISRKEFRMALADFVIGGGIRWYRHFLRVKMENNHFTDRLPIYKDVVSFNTLNSKLVENKFPEFPYHAMMVNLSQLTEVQGSALKLFEDLLIELYQEYNKNGFNQIEFSDRYQNQLNKSTVFSKKIPTIDDLKHFLNLFFKNLIHEIPEGNGNCIYLLNSKDEGQTLQYTSNNKQIRPKKATLVIGGNILARGLTIENLSVAIYCRSQVISLGDTNLQMCRWFGHKKSYIDLLTVYYQKHSQILFRDIAYADKQLRKQFKYYIFNNIRMECVVLSLFNSPLFRVTSPSKSKLISKSKMSSFSGVTVDILEPFKHADFNLNYGLLNRFFSNSNNFETYSENHLNRANVYFNVKRDAFRQLLKSLKFENKQLNFSINEYLEYLDIWQKEKGSIPGFNVAIFGKTGAKGILKRRRDRYNFSPGEEKSADLLLKRALPKLARYRGGSTNDSRANKYLGDVFVDMNDSYHNSNYSQNNSIKRLGGWNILFMFYLLDGNYVGIAKEGNDNVDVYYPVEHSNYLEGVNHTNPLVTFSISSPIGGPKYDVYTNKFIESLNCDDEIENLQF